MKMKTMVTKVKKPTFESLFAGEGRFYDETEIEKEYKDGPAQKDATYQNALGMWYPDRQCDVWRIPSITTKDLEKASHEKTLKRDGEGVEIFKKPKVPNCKKEPQLVALKEEAEAKDLTEGQQTTITKLKDQLKASRAKLTAKCGEVNKLVGSKMEHVDSATVKWSTSIEALGAEMTLVVEEGRVKDFKKTKEKVSEMMSKIGKHRSVFDLLKKSAVAIGKTSKGDGSKAD